MKLLSLFSGIGAFEKALDNLEIPYELVAYCEIDKFASKSYSAIHNVSEELNLGDITKVNEKELPKDIDLITYGFPCQDISVAGKQKGLFEKDGTQTRSGLFFEVLRIIEATKPRVAIAENVKNLTSKKFSEQFKIVLDSLESAGYNNKWCILNAKDFGIPQNRERIFIVSVRKDIDDGKFEFPQGFPLELRLKDVLESEVDEKYYIDNKKVEQFILNNPKIDFSKSVLGTCHERNDLSFATRDIVYNLEKESPTLTATMYKDAPKILKVGQLQSSYEQSGRIYHPNGISPTVTSNSHGNTTGGYTPIKIVEPFIQKVDIPQIVTVRKYPVDNMRLCECLRNHKNALKISNKDISEALGLPLTKVEHWFRKDEYFSIPDAEIWLSVKELLRINTNEFDESIMTFEEKNGVYEKSERHYFEEGIMPTLTSTTAGCEKILVREATKKGYAEAFEGDSINLEQPNSKTRRGRVGKQVAQTLTTSPQQAVVQKVEPFIVASRGRNPENQSDRTPGINLEQRLEPNSQGIANTLSTVLKDNYVCEPQKLQIRKLTPKECFRLMGFDDESFAKAEAVNSNTQLYKQAGNSICVPVVEHIITRLLECGALDND